MLRRINLIPPSERPRTHSDAGMLVLVVVAIVVVAGIAFSYVYFNGVLSDRKRELAQLQTQTAQVQSQLNALADYENLMKERQDAETVVQHIYAGRTLVSQTLGDLSLVIPKESWLQQLQLATPGIPAMQEVAADPNKDADVAGSLSITGETYTFEDVAKLMVRLEQIPSLETVVLGNAGGKETSGGTSGSSAKAIKAFALTAVLQNTQAGDTPLPISQVQATE